MTEIFEHVHYEIKASGFGDQLIGGVVVTGGGSASETYHSAIPIRTGLISRVGYPNEHFTNHHLIQTSHHSLQVGLVIRGYENT